MIMLIVENRKHRRNAKTTILSVVLLVLFTGTVHGQGRVYDFSLKDTENKTRNLSEIKGKSLTVIDFWATWCQPCIRSLPRLVELSEAYKDRGVAFVGISVDSPRNLSKVKPFARSMGIRYPVLLDANGALMGELNVTAVPTLLIIDSDYEVLYMHEGFSAGDELVIQEEIDRHLGFGGL
jgi:peroxiredoxin